LKGLETLKRPDTLAEPDQDQQFSKVLTQLKEPWKFLTGGVGLHDQAHDRPALVTQISPQGVLVIPAETGQSESQHPLPFYKSAGARNGP